MRKVSALLLAAERRAISGLAGLYASRMLGLFMVLPVLALYADTLTGATPLLVGVALGIYGLTQATLQIPFGLLSDRIGRKRVIAMGLLIFAFGSVVAAMATIGLSIGVSFAIAMVLGPWLASWAGLSGVFWFTALLTLVGLLVLWRWVPPAPRRLRHRDVGLDRKQFKSVITRPDLWRLDLSIFALHLVLMAIFVAIPFRLLNAGVAVEYHGLAYLGIMALSFVAMVPLVIIAEKRQRMRLMCLLAIGAIAASLASLGLSLSQGHWLFVWLFVFFTGFNLLEATLPSMLSKLAPAGAKGTAMGVYSTSQFLGAFLGGTLGGLLANTWGLNAVFIGCAVLALAWWVAMWRMPSPPPLSSEVVALHDTQPDAINLLMEHLADVVGVEDVMVVPEERLMYLKVNRKELDQAALAKLIPPPRP